jgi:hypothetical protein
MGANAQGPGTVEGGADQAHERGGRRMGLRVRGTGKRGAMTGWAEQGLEGRWALERVGGALPPLRPLHKLIQGGRGATRLGPVARLGFEVRHGPRGPELVYRWPFGFVRDRLTPDGGGGWAGRMIVGGVVVGRFRMRRDPPDGPGGDR